MTDENIQPVEIDGKVYPGSEDNNTEQPVQKDDLKLDDYDLYFKELLDIPEIIAEMTKRIMAISFQIDETNQKIKNIEKNYYLKVSKDKDDEGKLRFTNESMREAETKRLTYSDGEVSNYRIKLNSLNEKLNDAKIEKEKTEYRYKCLSKGIILCELKANLRDKK